MTFEAHSLFCLTQLTGKAILFHSRLGLFVLLLTYLSFFGVGCSTAKKTPKSGTSNTELRSKIVNYAQKQVGSPYLYAGKSPSTGFDCSGFTSYVLGEYKIKVSPSSSTQSTEGRKVDLDRVMPADLIFFGDNTRIQHVAMVVKRTKEGIICVHSTTSRGVVVENVSTSTYWKPKILYARDVISK